MSVFARFKNLLDYDGTVFKALGLNDDLQMLVEKVGGVKKPTKAEPSWRIPALPLHVQHLSKCLELQWTEAAAAHGRWLIAEAAERVKLSQAIESDMDFSGFGLTLHPYQKAGVEYMLRAKRVLLGDEMGLGKTAQMLGLMYKEPACYPILIISLASTKYWWKEEGEKCIPGKVFTVLDSKSTQLQIQMSDVCIVNYDLLAAGWETPEKKNVKLTPLAQMLLEHNFATVGGDEIQAIKSYKAQRTKAVLKLAEGKPYRIAITGTPVSNRASEVIPIAQFLGRMADLGGYMHFMKRYCAQKSRYNPFGGSNNGKELNERMRSSFYIRRTKDDVKLELPPLTRAIIPVEIDNRAEYQFAEDQLIEWVKKRAAEDEKFLQAVKDLPEPERLAAIEAHKHDKAERAKRAEAMIRIGALKDVAARGKLKGAIRWIDDFLESEEKLIVFATHKHMLDALRKRYPDAATVTSDMSAIERHQAVNRFQTDPKCQLMIGAYGTSSASAPAATGLTMTAASNVLTLELPWTSTHGDQAEARAYRMGQTKPVTSYYLIGINTIEKYIMSIIDSKRIICSEITDGADSLESTPPMVDLLMDELARG